MLQKYLLTFCNQGIISLLNFALNIALVRIWLPVDYGAFAITLIVVMTMEAFQNALINAPLSVHVPALTRRAPRALMEIMLSSISAILAFLAMLGGIGLAFVLYNDGNQVWLSAIVVGSFMASQLLRAYGRSYLFAQLRPGMVAISDLTYVIVGSLVILAVWLTPDAVTHSTVFGILLVGNLLAMVLSFTVARVALRLTLRWRVLCRYRESWKDSRWALTGVVTTTLQSRAHAMVVVSAYGEATFAALAAGAVLFGPMRMVLQAWGMITRPFLARAVGRKDRSEIVATNRLSLGAVLGGYALFIVLLYLFWDLVDAELYTGKYENMGLIVVLWAVVTLLFAGRALLAVPLQAMRQFKRLAFATALGAVVSLGSVFVFTFTFGFQYSIAGVGLGEAVSLAYVFYVYRDCMGKFAKGEAKNSVAEARG